MFFPILLFNPWREKSSDSLISEKGADSLDGLIYEYFDVSFLRFLKRMLWYSLIVAGAFCFLFAIIWLPGYFLSRGTRFETYQHGPSFELVLGFYYYFLSIPLCAHVMVKTLKFVLIVFDKMVQKKLERRNVKNEAY